jgi:hypothetical protein
MRIYCILLTLAACLYGQIDYKGDESPDAYITRQLRDNQKEIIIGNGRVTGTGADWLRTETAAAQFTFFGEEHDVAEVPRLLTGLWPDLYRAGYRHVAMETGQWLAAMLDRYARYGDGDALAAFYKAAVPRRSMIFVPPVSVEDSAFIGSLRRDRSYSLPLVWGLDHEFKLAPPLRRLRELISQPALQARIDTLLSRIESEGNDGWKKEIQSDIEFLAGAVGRQPPFSEVGLIIDALRRAQTEDRPFKQLFLRDYQLAQHAGENKPKVLLRLGWSHGKRGLASDFGTSTLGNFVAELAVAEGTRFLNVMFVSCADSSFRDSPMARSCLGREAVALKPFAEVAASEVTLFDLRKLRAEIRGLKPAPSWQIVDVLWGWDAIIWAKTTTPSSIPAQTGKAAR